jgi:Bacterial archaeo-eukaryotic release factor family 3
VTDFSREALAELLRTDVRPTASILMPTHRAGAEIRQDPIRLKTLVRGARHELERHGLEDGIAGRVLRPVEALLDDRAFWRHQDDGLALFAGSNFFRAYQVRWPLREAAVVGERFWVKPLLPALVTVQRFYVLALSQHAVRLVEATVGSASEIDLGDLPRNMDDALGFDRPEQNLQYHVVTTAGGERGAAFHGHLPGPEARKEACRQFFHQVDETVRRLMPDRQAPLVVAAVDYMLAIYREVNTHPGLIEDGLIGSPDGAAIDALAARAWEHVRPRLEASSREAVKRYEAVGAGLTSTDLSTVLKAAAQGRVADLFIATDVDRWGYFDPETSTLRHSDAPGPGVEDLLNLAAVYTIERAGQVHAVEWGAVPGGGAVAALFRY